MSIVSQSRRGVLPHESTIQYLDALLYQYLPRAPLAFASTNQSINLYDGKYTTQFYHHYKTFCYPTQPGRQDC